MIGQNIVYQHLNQLNIEFEYFEHQAIPTIDEAKKHKWWIDGVFCKNLFFRNHKGNQHYLVVVHHDTQLNITILEKKLRQGKLTFASEQRMLKYLGLLPGSVSPFGLLNDTEHHVYVFFDPKLRNASKLSFHPNDNKATLVLKANDFWEYMNSVNNRWEFMEESAEV